jgi:sugar lactone lactonase YvrE
MANMRLELAAKAANALGEGPVWSAGENRLYWVDIRRSALHALDSNGALHMWPLESAASCMGVCDSGGLILSCVDGIAKFDPETGMRSILYPMNYGPDGVRPNDGKVDPHGRFWFGTMWDGNVEEQIGRIFRFDGNGSPVEQLAGYHIPNTVAWSPDQKTMYLGDSLKKTIWAYDYDVTSGNVGAKRVFAVVEEENIVPDGSAIDSEGYLWNAQWGGARIVRYAPNGDVDRIIKIPTDNVTSCAFGGSDLDILYITTASIELSAEKRADQSNAGHLFAIHDTGACGIPDAKVRLN